MLKCTKTSTPLVSKATEMWFQLGLSKKNGIHFRDFYKASNKAQAMVMAKMNFPDYQVDFEKELGPEQDFKTVVVRFTTRDSVRHTKRLMVFCPEQVFGILYRQYTPGSLFKISIKW